jgi:hypothetical protein
MGLLSSPQKKTPDFHQGLEVWANRRVPLHLAPGVEGKIIEVVVRSSQMHGVCHLLAWQVILNRYTDM